MTINYNRSKKIDKLNENKRKDKRLSSFLGSSHLPRVQHLQLQRYLLVLTTSVVLVNWEDTP